MRAAPAPMIIITPIVIKSVCRSDSSSSVRTADEKILPADTRDSMAPRDFFVARCGNDKRFECWMAPTELQQAPKRPYIEAPGFDLHCPLSPTPVENGINLQWLFPPVRNLLALVNREGNTGVFDPKAEPIRFTIPIGRAVTMHGGEQSIVQHDEFGRRGPTPVRLQ